MVRACTRRACPQGFSSQECTVWPHAGEISFTNQQSGYRETLVPNEGGDYFAAVGPAEEFVEGDAWTLQLSGGHVPAATVTLRFPSALAVTPLGVSQDPGGFALLHSPDAPLDLVWAVDDSPGTRVLIQATSATASFFCLLGREARSATVPAELFTLFETGQRVYIYHLDEATLTLGEYFVRFRLARFAVDDAGEPLRVFLE
jgi:hypothetical protein